MQHAPSDIKETLSQPLRIDIAQRVCPHIGKGINTSRQSNRIPLHIPPHSRPVIPEVVLVQPTLPIKVLPRKPQVHRDGATSVYPRVPKRFTDRPPRLRTRFVCPQHRGYQVVCVQVVVARAWAAQAVTTHLCLPDRGASPQPRVLRLWVPAVGGLHLPLLVHFCHQAAVAIHVVRGLAVATLGGGFADSAPKGVVAVARLHGTGT